MRTLTILAIAACLIALGQRPLDAQFGGPFQSGGLGGFTAFPPQPVYGARVDPNAVIAIAEEPKIIDPATLLPPELTKNVTLKFENTPLNEAIAILKEKLAIDVLLDEVALNDEGIHADSPIQARVDDEPVYLLIDRMVEELPLGWDYHDGILRMTTETAEEDTFETRGYDLSGLLDDGYDARQIWVLLDLIPHSAWELVDGIGGRRGLVGDTLFVSQTFDVHSQFAGLLVALKKPARQTFVCEPSQTESLRALLQQPITVTFDKTPLNEALATLAGQIGASITIDETALSGEGIAKDTPVSLSLAEKPLRVVLERLLDPLQLSCVIEHGQLTVTTMTSAEEKMGMAVYDVRDLTRDPREAARLLVTIQEVTNWPWRSTSGLGGDITYARPGVLVVLQTHKIHDEVLAMIEQARAVRSRTPSTHDRPWEHTLETRYYRMSAALADYLQRNLPTLVAPTTWRSDERPNAHGTIERLPAEPLLSSSLPPPTKPDKNGDSSKNSAPEEPTESPIETVILAIRQTADVHNEINALRHRAEYGDEFAPSQGSFGGGFYSISE